MQWLNYHHLYYFWVVARRGSVARAGTELHLSQSAISTQIHQLEGALGVKLFARAGRRLVLTDAGKMVHASAGEIFAKGRELVAALRGGATAWPLQLVVGMSAALPQGLVGTLLKPILEREPPVRLVCRYEPAIERLLAAQRWPGAGREQAHRPVRHQPARWPPARREVPGRLPASARRQAVPDAGRARGRPPRPGGLARRRAGEAARGR